MYYRPARTLFGLIAVGGAVTVGIITHDAGFTALTFVGGLLLPRVLGFRSHRHGWGFSGGTASHHDGGRRRLEERLDTWHRAAHARPGGESPTVAGPAGA